MEKLKVHILYEYGIDSRPHGCAYIRLMLPLGHPANADSLTISAGKTYSSADVVIVDRTWYPGISPAAARDLVRRTRSEGSALVYSIDDNLLDLKPQGFNRWPFTTDELMTVRYFARAADGVIVTTDLLKERLSRLNPNIFVVPNSLDERLWEKRPITAAGGPIASQRKTIGYMGTATHDADLMMVAQGLRNVLRKYANSLELQLVGAVADPAVIEAFAGLPIRIVDVGDNVEYPAFARWMVENIKWDLAIAPLENDVFTRCKSDIKFLDYSAVGIPGIYSQGPVYGRTVRHLDTGYLANNDPQSWTDALELLLNDDALRLGLAKRAQEYVFSTRTLEHRAHEWRDALVSIVSSSAVVPESVGRSHAVGARV